jgi:hypothetical protein
LKVSARRSAANNCFILINVYLLSNESPSVELCFLFSLQKYKKELK